MNLVPSNVECSVMPVGSCRCRLCTASSMHNQKRHISRSMLAGTGTPLEININVALSEIYLAVIIVVRVVE